MPAVNVGTSFFYKTISGDKKMSWVNVGRIKGDTGDTGSTGSSGGSAYITLDSAHGIIYLGDDDHDYSISLSSLKGPKGDTGATGPVNLVSTLDTTDSTNAVTNGAIATAIQNVSNQIGTITSAQTANLTLLGS